MFVGARLRRTRPLCSLADEHETARSNKLGICSLLLIFVENHSINHYIVPCANVMDSDWNADFHSGAHDIFIEHFTAPRHVCDRLTKAVGSRAAAFLKHDYTSRSVFRDGSAAFGGS